MANAVLDRSFYEVDAGTLAPLLLNKVLVHRGVSGRIVEVEAYGGADDPASHGYRGKTPRNAVMFGPAGFLYVYLSYGMHYCCNVVAGRTGEATAVLLRALAPLEGIDEMRSRRNTAKDRLLAAGPGRLCQAMAIDRSADGADLVVGDRGIEVIDDGLPPPTDPGQGPRIGIRVAENIPWRWWLRGDPNLSRPG